MDQELKQRLIGAVVVTALAAIFIPMLFDDPVDDRSQQVSELAIPATPPASTGEEISDKAPADAKQVLNGNNPEEAYVEELEASEEEPMQPIEGPDVDEEGGLIEEVPTSSKPKQGGSKAKPVDVEDVAVIEDIDQEAEAKIDADVEKLRPKANAKPNVETTGAGDTAHGKATPKPDAKVLVAEKPAPIKKPPTDTANVKPKALAKPPVDGQTPANAKLTPASKPASPAEAAKKPANTAKAAAPKAKTEAKRWYIQVGSFGKKENALSLWESLRKDGFPVSLDTLQGEKGTLYRLKIGPELEAKRAADMKARLDKHNVNSILIAE